jgi:hypothetical protein
MDHAFPHHNVQMRLFDEYRLHQPSLAMVLAFDGLL